MNENEEIEKYIEYNLEADTEDADNEIPNNKTSHERGIDVVEARIANGDEGISELHLDLKQRMLVRQHMNEHRPSLPAVLPTRSQGKDLAKWLGITDGPNSPMHANRKKQKKDKLKVRTVDESRYNCFSSSR